jgi:hypothetical protein
MFCVRCGRFLRGHRNPNGRREPKQNMRSPPGRRKWTEAVSGRCAEMRTRSTGVQMASAGAIQSWSIQRCFMADVDEVRGFPLYCVRFTSGIARLRAAEGDLLVVLSRLVPLPRFGDLRRCRAWRRQSSLAHGCDRSSRAPLTNSGFLDRKCVLGATNCGYGSMSKVNRSVRNDIGGASFSPLS